MLTQSATLHNCLCSTVSASSRPSTLGDISYDDTLMRHPAPAPVHWAASYTHKELSLLLSRAMNDVIEFFGEAALGDAGPAAVSCYR